MLHTWMAELVLCKNPPAAHYLRSPFSSAVSCSGSMSPIGKQGVSRSIKASTHSPVSVGLLVLNSGFPVVL